ncbi:MAG: hypothetical protein VCC00_11795 [Deltaproteobacteria bacterium]
MRLRLCAAQRGIVLISALLLLVLLTAATGAGLWLVRSDLWAAGAARAELQALYTAEAGLFAAAAGIAPATLGLNEPEAWQALPIGIKQFFPGPPFGYRLRNPRGGFGSGGRPLLRLEVESEAVAGARRHLEATIVRREQAYAPAAMLIRLGGIDLTQAALSLATAPNLRLRGTVSAPALAAAGEEVERRLFALLADSRVHVRPRGPIGFAAPIAIAAFAAATGRPVEAGPLFSPPAGGAHLRFLGGGTLPNLVGDGLVVSLGDLRIENAFDFAGVLLVAGRLELDATTCRMRGFVQADSLVLHAPCEFVLDPQAVRAADALEPLPRAARVHSLQDKD